MPIPAPASSWSEEILEAAREEFNAVVTIKEPDVLGTYDPVLNTRTGGSVGATLISSRAARVQHVGQPRERNDGNGWSTERRIRMQFEILPGDPVIPKGVVAVVENGGEDPQLEEFTYQVLNAINSSHAALRTVECMTEAGV